MDPTGGIPQGQEMGAEVKIGTLVAGRRHLSVPGRDSSSRDGQIFVTQLGLPSWVWGDFLVPLGVTERIYMVKCACEPDGL